MDGNTPSAILNKCSKQLSVLDGHFATVLVGVVAPARHEITLANAGHLNPLLIDGEQASYLATPPIGWRIAYRALAALGWLAIALSVTRVGPPQ